MPTTLDFTIAKLNHQKVINQVALLISGADDMSESQASDYKACSLGQWLYSTGLQQYGARPEMQELERVHADFHTQVQQIVRLKHGGNNAQARQEMNKLEATAQKVMSLLEALERYT